MDAATAASAGSGGYVDDAVAALATTNVYVSPYVKGSSALTDSLLQQVGDASIGIAVFPDNASVEASGPDIVAQLVAQTGYDTIIVAVGDNLDAGSTTLDKGEAASIANQAESSAGSTDAALVQTVQGVIAASDSPSGPTLDGGLIVGVVLAVVALVAVAGVAIGVVRSRRKRSRAGRGTPDAIRTHIATLRSLSGEYAAVGARGNQVAAQTGAEIATIGANVGELFERLDKRGDGQSAIAAAEYDDKLRKLTAALNRDYLLDILTHPNLWDDPDDRIREVRGAVTAVSDELIANIKQVNARQGLHFQVSLDGLIGGRKELQDWEREFDRATGEGEQPA